MTESQKNVLSFIDDPCLKNREKAFDGYIKLADSLVVKYYQRGFELNDMKQIAYMAINKSLDKYDPSKGYQFITYVYRAICNSLLNFIKAKYYKHSKIEFLNVDENDNRLVIKDYDVEQLINVKRIEIKRKRIIVQILKQLREDKIINHKDYFIAVDIYIRSRVYVNEILSKNNINYNHYSLILNKTKPILIKTIQNNQAYLLAVNSK